MIGQTVAHYRVLDKLGGGGMGEVYLAEDTRLHRRVALKVLPTLVASDPEHLERFAREAKTLAGLNHPNIVTVYSVEEAGDQRLLVMELIEGRTLAALIPRGGLPRRAVLRDRHPPGRRRCPRPTPGASPIGTSSRPT